MKFIIYFITLFVALIFGTNVCANDYSHEDNQIGVKFREITKLRGSINRIVSLAPNITEILFSLGAQDRIVGVTQYSDYPVQARLLPKVGSYISLDLEKIVALKPDICFATKEGNPIEVIHRLKSLNIPVYISDPSNLDSVLSLISDIGFLLETETKANFLVDDLTKRINYIKLISSRAKQNPRIFFQLDVAPIVSAGEGTIIDSLIDTIRGINVVKKAGLYPHLTREDVLRLAPDIIIITSTKINDPLTQEKYEWESWIDLPASLNNNVFIEEGSLFDRASPRLVDGLELLAKKAYPELFEDLL